MRMIPSIKQTVGFIYADYGDHYEPLGTGFFAWILEDFTRCFYLITCKHVVDKEIEVGTPLYVRLNHFEADGVGFTPLNNEWFYHSDKAIDIAVTPFDRHPDVSSEFEPVDIKTVFLPGNPLDYVFEGFDVAFIGLLTSIPGKSRNTPIYRYGHIAMMLDQKIKGAYGEAEYLLVECVAYKGNSGSPLWIAIPTPTKEEPDTHTLFIAGMMTQIYLKEEIDSKGYGRTVYHSGLSQAVPINYVRDILLGDKLMADRKKRAEQGKSPNDDPVPISNRPINVEGNPFDRSEFIKALEKVSRPKPTPREKGKSETSE